MAGQSITTEHEKAMQALREAQSLVIMREDDLYNARKVLEDAIAYLQSRSHKKKE